MFPCLTECCRVLSGDIRYVVHHKLLTDILLSNKSLLGHVLISSISVTLSFIIHNVALVKLDSVHQ